MAQAQQFLPLAAEGMQVNEITAIKKRVILSCMSSPLMSCGRIARAATKCTTAKVGNNENLGSSSSGELRFSCLMCAFVPMHGKRWNPELPSMPIFEGFWNLSIAYGIRLIWGSTALCLMWAC